MYCGRLSARAWRSIGYATCVASLPKRLHTLLSKRQEVSAGGCKLTEIRAKYTAEAEIIPSGAH
jgi:hypothetical protein